MVLTIYTTCSNTSRSGQTHVLRWLKPLTKMIQEGKIETTFPIKRRSANLADGLDLYRMANVFLLL